MKVIEYLKMHGPAKLTEELGVKVKEYLDDGLLVLNYHQIESPKAHPVVMECRGLILDVNYNVVSRAFDRFFNFGEQPETQAHIDMRKASCFDKVDGSLIKIYFWRGAWMISTRGTAFAESTCNFGDTFYNLTLKATLGDEGAFQECAAQYLNPDWTYICELTCAENRIVKRYDGYTLHYLAARHNRTYEYGGKQQQNEAENIGAIPVKSYRFDSVDACIEVAKNLKDLDEGYVLYQDGAPVCKIKSPTYVAVHHIRGEGLSPKRICALVLSGEHEEYLSYFEADRKFFTPYIEHLENVKAKMQSIYDSAKDLETQKDFALAVKDYPFSGILFTARKNQCPIEAAFNQQTELYRIRMLARLVGVDADAEVVSAE